MEYSFIIAVIPVILVVAFLVWIAKKITDGERLDMKEGVLGVVILMVAVLIMVPMISSTQVYTWDDDTGELVIQQNISGGSYAWDTYDSQIRSIVIKPGVTQIGNSAFDGATNIEYLSIPESVTDIGTNAFGVTFKDPFGNTVSDIAGAEYAGSGSGTLYQCDPTIFTYNGASLTGLVSSAQTASYIVIPTSHDGTVIDTLGAGAFSQKPIVEVFTLPDSEIADIRGSCFSSCASLVEIHFPDTLQHIGGSCFARSSVEIAKFPDGLLDIGQYAFQECTSLSILSFPASLTSSGAGGFYNTRGVTEVSFETGFSPSTIDYGPWTFYESDGVTQIERTAANLAGKTFMGTNSALIEVAAGTLSLTPQQLQQVQLHTQELQDISIDPLPLQPSLQEQELTA